MYVNTACHRVKHLCFQVVLAEHQVMPKNLEYFYMEFITHLVVEGKVNWKWCEQLQNVLIAGSALFYSEILPRHLTYPLLRNGLTIFNDFFMPFFYDFYCSCFICRCLDFCQSFSASGSFCEALTGAS